MFKMFISFTVLILRISLIAYDITIHISNNHLEKLNKMQNILGEVTIEMRGWYNLNN